MLSARRFIFSLAMCCLVAGVGCSFDQPLPVPDAGTHTDVHAPDVVVMPCDTHDDPDRDGIPSRLEAAGDSDSDGVPDARDPDSDDDGIPDALEAGGGGRYTCGAALVDSDRDGAPDVRDTDSNGDTIADAVQSAPSPAQPATAQPPRRDCLNGNLAGVRVSAVTAWTCHPYDTDGDGVADVFDDDADGDGIRNPLEIAPGDAMTPSDFDRDGVPDYRDRDSDNDAVLDRHESAMDRDGDGAPNFRDIDADNDGAEMPEALGDRTEAGDNDPETTPRECARELDARALDMRTVRPDGVPDFLDVDSDNDGLGDREEVRLGTSSCNPDSDGDGQLDSIEAAWCLVNQRAHCATDRGVVVPASEVWAVLPFNGGATTREVELSATLRAVDLFFLVETSSRTEAFRTALAAAMSTPTTGTGETFRSLIPDLELGVGRFEDFDAPTPGVGRYGAVNDRPFWPLCEGAPGTAGCRVGWGIQMQPLSRIADVIATTLAFTSGSPDGDTAASQVEALYQTITGSGLFTGDAASVCAGHPGRAPCWIAPRNCPEGTRGAPCFRREAQPVVVLATASDFHDGAPARAGALPWAPYVGIAPMPHTFDEMTAAFVREGAHAIGINLHPTARCETPSTMRVPAEPCFDLAALARGTRTLDRAGVPLVYDLPSSSSLTAAQVTTTLLEATRTLVRSVPFDVTLAVRSDPRNATEIDVTRLIRARTPSCELPGMSGRCWTPPPGVPMTAAVSRTDANGLYAVLPGTRVRFTLTLRNEGVIEADVGAMRVLRLLVDILGDGAVLDTRFVHIVVPAAQGS